MKLRKLLRYEAANLICWYRILLSLTLCFVPTEKWICAPFYSLALVSDVWDGWCYKRLTEPKPYRHWFNRLPLGIDPLADFIFVGGGIIHTANNRLDGFKTFAVIALCMVFWQVLARTGSDRLFAIMITALTYLWFAAMIFSTALVWYYDARRIWAPGLMITLITFYVCWIPTYDWSRIIRRRRK